MLERIILSGKIFGWFCGVVLIGGSTALILFSCHENYVEDKECKARGGKSYVLEEHVTTTSDNCHVIAIHRYTADCKYKNSVYVTECNNATTLGDGSNPKKYK